MIFACGMMIFARFSVGFTIKNGAVHRKIHQELGNSCYRQDTEIRFPVAGQVRGGNYNMVILSIKKL